MRSTINNLIDQYVKLVTAIEPSSEEYVDEIEILKLWIDHRRTTVENYIESGGVEGIPGPMECYNSDEVDGMNDIGEFVTIASHSCSHMSDPKHNLWLLCFLLVLTHLRKPQHN